MKKIFVFIRGIALILATVMAMIAVTFSWFTHDRMANVDTITGNAVQVVPNGSTIYGTFDNVEGWHAKVDLNFQEALVPIAGNGIKFYKEKYVQKTFEGSDYIITVKDGYEEINVADASGVICMDFKLRNNFDSYLMLNSDSYLLPASLTDDGGEQSIKDMGAGAMRICIQKKINGAYQPLFIWIPNVEYELSLDEAQGIMTGNFEGGKEAKYFFRYGTGINHIHTLIPDSDAGMQTVNSTLVLWGDLKQIEGLGMTPIGECAGGMVEEDYRLIIWVEGSDRECSEEIMGGVIRALISFDTVPKEDRT